MSELRSYIRDKKGNPIGIIVATGKHNVGYSMCHTKDKWDKNVGLAYAYCRANEVSFSDVIKHCPPSIITKLNDMIERASRYYKDNTCRALDDIHKAVKSLGSTVIEVFK